MKFIQAKRVCFSVCIAFVSIVLLSNGVFAQTSADASGQPAIWEKVSKDSVAARGERRLTPEKYEVFRLNRTELDKTLKEAPLEFSSAARDKDTILMIPKPDGKLVRFRIEESPMLAPQIAAQFPTWKTYQGVGIDEPSTFGRFSLTDAGFHGYIISPEGTFSIDPYQTNDTENYLVFFKNQYGNPTREFHCKLDEALSNDESLLDSFLHPLELLNDFSHGAQLRTYRLAVATTFEYTQFFRQPGDTDPQAQTRALNQVVISINRINTVYRKEVAVSFTLVSGTNLTYVVNPETPSDYANNGSSADLNVNQTNVDSIIGAGNYDIGHVFQTGFGGIAQLSSVCGGSKARGLSGLPDPQGDPFDVDFVAHEMGHQFGGNHTFNSPPNCGSSPSAARKEPGSAVTIMGYAGICNSTANVARNSIDTFHVYNQTEIIAFLAGTGGTCGTLSGANAIPVLAPLTIYTIPFNTPFELTASATDGNNDPLTYSWEQNDSGASQANYPGTTDDDDIGLVFRPGFRSYLPRTTGSRMFPSLPYILNNSNEAPITFTGTSATGTICEAGVTCITGEDLPSAARTMNFRVTVRDNNGGVADAGTVLTVINTTTPFKVTSQNTSPATWAGGSSQTITWDVSGTNGAPISAANVKISLSTDGGQTFPNVLAASTPNDGTQAVTIPNIATTQARIKVEAVGNIFFDINDANFTITASAVNRKPYDFDGDGKDDVSVYRNGIWYLLRSQLGFAAVSWGLAIDKTVAGDYDGDGKTDTAIFRNGLWIILNSSNNAVSIVNWGQAGDIPMVGDYDGDNKTDFTVFRNGVWYILQSSTGGFVFTSFGLSTDKPVVGKFDNDNRSDIAVFRNGIWYILGSTAGFSAVGFGTTGDIPVPADFDGDGRTDQAVYRSGIWYILGSTTGFSAVSFGISTDTPVPADYDGDNKSDVAVFRNGNWFILNSGSGFSAVGFGTTGDKPIPAQLQ